MTKADQRREAYRARAAQSEPALRSLAICRRLFSHVGFQSAATVMWYVGCRSEVQTDAAISETLALAKSVVVPYCTQDAGGDRCLGLWQLRDTAELRPGTWRIPEPPLDRRDDATRSAAIADLDLIVVPGVAFDRNGGRLGNGAGYYDRLLSRVRADCLLVGICYESQMMSAVVTEPHDIFMDYVITEAATYRGRGRTGGPCLVPV